MAELYGMIHLPQLRAHSNHKIDDIIEYAVSQTLLLDELGYDGVLIENFGDGPFAKSRVSDVVLAKLSVICHEVRKEGSCKIGLNILRNASVQAMAIATVLDLDFIRSNIWEGAYVTDQGIIEGAAHDVIQLRDTLHSSIEIFADVFVKHATPLSDFDIVEAAKQATGRGGADRIVISGRHTGDPIDLARLNNLNDAGILPVIGSGLRLQDIEKYTGKISGAIVGSAIKTDDVTSPIDITKAKELQAEWQNYF